MKKVLIPVIVLLVIAFLITGCGSSSTTSPATTPPTNSTPGTTKPATPVTTPPTSTTPTTGVVKGGILRIIAAAGPQVLSYVPDMGPNDAGAVFPAVERLMDATTDRSQGIGLEPVLAQSVDDDIANNRIVFHLRPGVKFSDGSDLNADVVIWNFQQLIDAGRLQYQNFFKGIKKLDDMTVEIDYTTYTNQLLPSWGWTAIYSKQAWDQNSGGDLQKGRDWARTHVVGTGPFILQEFVRDDHMTWVKNPNYWKPGEPYLDGIKVTFIPDPTTAQNIMLAGQADEWDSPTAQAINDLVNKGLTKVSSWPGLVNSIWPNTTNTSSPFYNSLALRQAIAYAIDRPTLAKVLGFGNYIPMNQLAPEGEWGYDPNYQGIPYDPAKAKQLLAEAGYPNGLKVNLLIGNDAASLDAGTAIKQYLDAVGFQTNLDVADPGRFYGTVWGNTIPVDEMTFMWSGMDTNYLMTYMRWFSSDPFTNVAFLGRTDEQKALDKQAEAIPDATGQQKIAMDITNYMNQNARVIPLYLAPATVITAPYVHTTRFSQGFVRWQSEIVWMDKH